MTGQGALQNWQCFVPSDPIGNPRVAPTAIFVKQYFSSNIVCAIILCIWRALNAHIALRATALPRLAQPIGVQSIRL